MQILGVTRVCSMHTVSMPAQRAGLTLASILQYPLFQCDILRAIQFLKLDLGAFRNTLLSVCLNIRSNEDFKGGHNV